MEQILQGIPGVHCILDDMIVTGQDGTEHLQNLESVSLSITEVQPQSNFGKMSVSTRES